MKAIDSGIPLIDLSPWLTGDEEARDALAADIDRLLVDEFHAVVVTVEVRKFILPNADHVAVRCRLER